MGKDCRCALVEQIVSLLETLPLARATCRVMRPRSHGDDAGWAMADPGPGPDHRRREPGWRLEGGGGTGLLAHARSGSILFAAGRLSVLDGLRRPHRGLELRARPHSRPLRAPPAPIAWLLRRPADRGAANSSEQGYRGHGTVHGPRRPRHHRKRLNARRDLGDLLQDNLSGMKEIQVFSRETREKRRVRGQAQRHTRDRLKANKLEALWTPGIEVIAGAGTVIVAWFGGRAALQGKLPVEDLVAFVLYLGLFYQPLRLLARTSESFQEARTGAQHVWEVLDLQPEVVDPTGGVDSGRVQGKVVFENVDFEYEPDLPILNNVSFEIKPGQTLALVGPTGAGKSTIVSLIPRFYDPKRGRVLIDGIDISEMRLASVRRNVSMVLQDTFLFAGTVKENLRFGNERASDEEIVAAAKAANAHSFIEALPRGYDTRVGERGVKLSGGQKQRLSIARAILKDAPILILDEATSSVDTETEEEIQQALQELMQGRTTIVIAHRLSTVRHADLIAVLEGGSIVELGTHEHLMRCKGRYRKLYDRQFSTAA